MRLTFIFVLQVFLHLYHFLKIFLLKEFIIESLSLQLSCCVFVTDLFDEYHDRQCDYCHDWQHVWQHNQLHDRPYDWPQAQDRPMTSTMTDPMTDLMTEIMSDKNCCVRTVSHSCTVFLLEIEFCAKVEWKECRSIICLYYTQSRGVSKYNNATWQHRCNWMDTNMKSISV